MKQSKQFPGFSFSTLSIRNSLFFLILLLFYLLSFPALSTTASFDSKELQQILKDAVEKRRTVGIVVGVVDVNSKAIFSCGKTFTGGRDVDENSVFEIGSITKTFTAILLADMVMRGEVNLNDPVAKYLPKNVKFPTRGGKEITLLDLATHRSGLPRIPTNIKPADPDNPYADYNAEKLFDFLSNYTLPRDIGESYEYSNLGVGLLGEALARRAGQSYETLLIERIFRPLGMNSSGIVLRSDMLVRLARGHSEKLIQVKNLKIGVLAGGGAIRSTIGDMLNFLAANIGLKPSTLADAIFMAQKDHGGTSIPDMRIGLSWHLMKRPDAVITWHNGGTGGYHSFIGFDLKKKLGIVILSNCINSIDDIGFHFLDNQLPLSKFKPSHDRKEITLEPDQLDVYIGEYQISPNLIITITKEANLLFGQVTGQSRYRLYPESVMEFFIKEVDAQISFPKSASGKMTHLILHQGGLDLKASKIK